MIFKFNFGFRAYAESVHALIIHGYIIRRSIVLKPAHVISIELSWSEDLVSGWMCVFFNIGQPDFNLAYAQHQQENEIVVDNSAFSVFIFCKIPETSTKKQTTTISCVALSTRFLSQALHCSLQTPCPPAQTQWTQQSTPDHKARRKRGLVEGTTRIRSVAMESPRRFTFNTNAYLRFSWRTEKDCERGHSEGSLLVIVWASHRHLMLLKDRYALREFA